MRIAVHKPSSLDPALLHDPAGTLIDRQLFDTLVEFDPVRLQLVPSLASKWETLDGGARFVFHIRPKARFHNGRVLTADDAAFALNRLAQKATGSEVGFLLDAVKGYESVGVKATSSELEGIKVVDASTLEITLGAPWIEFPYVLTNPATAPLPRTEFLADPASFKTSPIGTGPYLMKTRGDASQDLVLRRFDRYWGKAPAYDGVKFLVYDQTSGAYSDLQDGRVDITDVPPDQSAEAEARFGKVGFGPVAAGLYLGVNIGKLADVRLRQAISLALDREAIAHSIFNDVMSPASSLIPPGIPGRVPKACETLCEYAPDRARSLVRQAAPQGPPSVTFAYQKGEPQETLAKLVQKELADVGITVNLQPLELTDFLDVLEKGQTDLFRLGWVAEYPLADWFVSPLFRSNATDNHSRYTSPQVDDAINAARSEAKKVKRVGAYESLDLKLTQELALIPIGSFKNRYVAAGTVGGFYVDALGGFEVARMHPVAESDAP